MTIRLKEATKNPASPGSLLETIKLKALVSQLQQKIAHLTKTLATTRREVQRLEREAAKKDAEIKQLQRRGGTPQRRLTDDFGDF